MNTILWALAFCVAFAALAVAWGWIDDRWNRMDERQDDLDKRLIDINARIDERLADIDGRLGTETGQRKQLGHYVGYLEADLEADLGSVKRKVEALPPSLWLEGSSPIGDGLPKLPRGLRRLPTADDTCEGR